MEPQLRFSYDPQWRLILAELALAPEMVGAGWMHLLSLRTAEFLAGFFHRGAGPHHSPPCIQTCNRTRARLPVTSNRFSPGPHGTHSVLRHHPGYRGGTAV